MCRILGNYLGELITGWIDEWYGEWIAERIIEEVVACSANQAAAGRPTNFWQGLPTSLEQYWSTELPSDPADTPR